jgi:hypothetical protein
LYNLGRERIERMNDTVFRQKRIESIYIDEDGMYVKAEGREVEYVGFWLRLYGEHFRPCLKCQTELIELLNNAELSFKPNTMAVYFHQRVDEKKDEIYYAFGLPFINQLISYEWKPCATDQKVLRNIIIKCKHFRIGNKEYTDPVEFYREFEVDDKSWKELEHRKPTKEEIELNNKGEL